MEKTPQGLELISKYFGDFSEKQLEQFAALGALYEEWNNQINVISRKDIGSLYEKHILHSLAIAATFELSDGTEVLDIGTGGGFPGVPLAIFFPEVQFHLVDSIGKKLKVVEAVSSAIGLTNLTTQHTRVEDIKNRKFDTVVSRAVAPLTDLWKWAKPVIRKINPPTPGNGLICLKGGDLHSEIQQSGTRPRMMPLSDIFEEEFFKEKFLVYVGK